MYVSRHTVYWNTGTHDCVTAETADKRPGQARGRTHSKDERH